ncbi:MAG: glycosyltransferase family 4 protein [Nodosilinea sp.]
MSKKIIVISPVPSHPQTAGNRARIYSLLIVLRDLGYTVHFVHIQETLGDTVAMREAWGCNFHVIPYRAPDTRKKRFSRRLDQRIVRRLQAWAGNDPRYNFEIDDWYDDSVTPYLSKLAEEIRPDVVMVEYVFFSKALECFDQDCTKIIDTHDIFAGRYKLYQRQGHTPQWFSTTSREECKGLKRADIIVAIQSGEANYFATQRPAHRVVTVGHLMPVVCLPRPQQSHKLLFLASQNPINVDAFNYFIQTIFPFLKDQVAELELLLVGDICDHVADYDGCRKLGSISNLQTAYEKADIIINPIQFGTGLKIKNIEALAFGKPLVTTSIGAFGLESGIGSAFVVADNPHEFVIAIVDLLTDEDHYQRLSTAALAFANRWNQICLASLSDLLAKATVPSPVSSMPL